MLNRFRVSLAFAVCAAVAACSSEPPPAAPDAKADASGAAAKADVRDPRTPNSTASARTPGPRLPTELDNTDRPGDMPKQRPTGRVECDQFGEKLRQCVNSGVLSPESRETLRSEYVVAMNGAKFRNADLAKTCLDLQEKLQPKLVQAGCRNF
ncbi:MAG TPA: hypothetical protein VLF18_07260 [Tahibacter sp.]|uniref:hypothetical protein n=1 Tax=Tahibacter sp. TaxID=2056211 RepID=UPI002BDB3DB9|nr:hypothetical protein [Tahibacter sp.]HSX59978.1 hypothetical protein [Tahibacter sp.]